jgi:hypothetical protein
VVVRPSETSLFEGKDLTEFPFPTQKAPAETTASEYRPNYLRDALKEFLEGCMLPDDLPQRTLTTKDFLDATRCNSTLMAQFLQWLGERKELSEPALVSEPGLDDKEVYQGQRPQLTKRQSARIRGRNTSAQRLISSDKKRKVSADSITTRKTLKRQKN